MNKSCESSKASCENEDGLFTLKVTIAKFKQIHGKLEPEDSAEITSHNLSLQNVIDMRGELLPVLAGFNTQDEV